MRSRAHGNGLFAVLAALWVSAAMLGRARAGQADTATSSEQTMPGPVLVIRADPRNNDFHLPPPPEARGSKFSVENSVITVNYIGAWTSDAQNAFQAAVNIWASLITAGVPINIDANWVALGTDILGSASATSYRANFAGAPLLNTWYPDALANKLHGSDLDVSNSEITANFSSNFANWYFGTDGNTPAGYYDFETVVLHELCHGLGFGGSMQVGGGCGAGQGCWGGGTAFPFIYDRFTEDGSSTPLLGYASPSAALAVPLTSGDVYWNSPVPLCRNGGDRAKLYCPATWKPGSSYSHLDEIYNNTHNGLMTYSLEKQESDHDPGPIARGMLDDIGWANPLRSLSGLTGIKIYESTGSTTIKTYANPNDPELLTQRPDLLGPGNSDLTTTAQEYYDFFYSDIDGTPNSNGSYLTIECRFDQQAPSGGGLNILAVQLTGIDEWANSICSFVASGNNYLSGSERNALGPDLTLDTVMGNSLDVGRLRITLGFGRSTTGEEVLPIDASCAAVQCPGTFHVVDFEAATTGTSVEGLGAVDADLDIESKPWAAAGSNPSCPSGAMVIETGSSDSYASFGSGPGTGGTDNACLDGVKGFGDDQGCVLDYDFRFAPGVSVSCFSIRVLDFGDYFPFNGSDHSVTLTAFDASNHPIDTAVLDVTGGEKTTGDACVSQGPGNTVLRVSGSHIKRVALTNNAYPDPNVGYDDIQFCEEVPQSCACGPTHVVTFESNATGSTVEGAGTVEPDLDIASLPWTYGTSCSTVPKVIDGTPSSPYASYSSGTADNACLDGSRGFGDDQECVLDYQFTFPESDSVTCFSIRVVDYGDYFPYGGDKHQVALVAYNSSNSEVDRATLNVKGSGSFDGDACVSQAGEKGNYILKVGGPGIVKVQLLYDEFPDPNVGYDDIAFCEGANVSVPSAGVARDLAITEIRPNPVAERTTITFTAPSRRPVEARIFDLSGRQVADLSPGLVAPGIHTIEWNGRKADGARARPGMYLLRLRAADKSAVARMIVVY